MLTQEDVVFQAKAFLARWLRLGGNIEEAFKEWVESKDLSDEDTDRIWSVVKETVYPDTDKLLEALV